MTQQTLLVQDFLKTNTFQQLINQHGVYASPSKCGTKISLNYSQIESSNSDKLAQQCRGLILRPADFGRFNIVDGRLVLDSVPGETKIVAYPFNRFFNYGMEDAVINWSDKNLRVVEKLDGTLIIMYFDYAKREWHCATRSVPEADLDGGNGFTFRSLVEDALKQQYGVTDFNQLVLCKSNTYMFELTSYYNRVVVDHKETKLTLIGARCSHTLEEIDVGDPEFHSGLAEWDAFNIINMNVVKQHSLKDIKEIISHVEAQNPLESEGVIAIDSSFNRVKVKSAAYVALHHTISSAGSSDRNLLTLILSEQDDDVICNLPDKLASKLVLMKAYFVNYARRVDLTYQLFQEIAEKSDDENKRKEFALALKRYNISWQAPYFMRYTGKNNSFLEFVKKSKNKNEDDWSTSFKDNVLEELSKSGLNLE